MDELGIDTQVLYPTTLALSQVTSRPEVDVALSRSYNRWLADAWEQSDGRLRWIAVPGVLNMDEALLQVRWAAEHGACGVLVRPFEGDRLMCDPYFYPLYEEAQNFDLPIAVHDGNANPAYTALVAGEAFSGSKLPILSAVHTLICHGVPDRFPSLRWGFIEAAASWLPWLVIDLRRRLERTNPALLKENFLRDNRMYVTCQTNDDLPWVMRYVGEDNLVIGTDYGHADTSSELEALKNLQRDSDLPPLVVHKILEDNPKALYGL
jgi:predicted TIM-barrel fold metal-dependent hydrolase